MTETHHGNLNSLLWHPFVEPVPRSHRYFPDQLFIFHGASRRRDPCSLYSMEPAEAAASIHARGSPLTPLPAKVGFPHPGQTIYRAPRTASRIAPHTATILPDEGVPSTPGKKAVNWLNPEVWTPQGNSQSSLRAPSNKLPPCTPPGRAEGAPPTYPIYFRLDFAGLPTRKRGSQKAVPAGAMGID